MAMATLEDEKDLGVPQDYESTDGDGSDNGAHGQEGEQIQMELAKKEDKMVVCLRIFTAVLLIAVALTVCLGVYFQGRTSEEEDFENNFQDLSSKLVSSFENVVQQRFGVIQSFGQDITSQANGSWPFVTPRDYMHRVQDIVRLSQVMMLFFMPIVKTLDQVPAWETYANENRQWREQGVAVSLGIDIGKVQLPPYSYNLTNNDSPGGPAPAVLTSDGPYTPIWSTYPAFMAVGANSDFRSDQEHRGPIDNTIKNGKPSFETPVSYVGKEKDKRHDAFQSLPHVDYQSDAFNVAFFPIFDGFGQNKTVAGIFLVIIYWRTYFESLLPTGANGVIVVLETTCNETFTYRVDGGNATFVGDGDLHDTKYDYLGLGTNVASLVGGTSIDQQDDEASAGGCKYAIQVYPSEELEDSYRTDKPWIYAVSLAAIFVFTSIVFLVYGWMVERRQKIVLEHAIQSGTLVSSLFPEAVRKQLYDENKKKAQEKDNRATWTNNTNEELTVTETEHKAAIAHLYEETTIFFSDLVGFTKWSSSRSPAEVFELLEQIYSVFDSIAGRRKVFKVETIGDAYVAVTGLPDPQVDHASICVRFALDCMRKLDELTTELAENLGEDTANLKMRVGLHSGPVTAGVLRGQKARFQLFGDSVNTAARMESNGAPGRIQCSEATAQALIARGKSHWLTPREDKIVAKGKGEMQTYWVAAGTAAKSTKSNLTRATTSDISASTPQKLED